MDKFLSITFTVFILLLVLGWLAYRFLPYLLSYLFRRKIRKMQEQARQEAGQRKKQSTGSPFGFPFDIFFGSEHAHKSHRDEKKIGKDVGEYVEFEDICIKVTETADSTTVSGSATRVKFTPEQQVQDAEWEDI